MNDFDSVPDWIAAGLLLIGAFLCLTAGLGVLRFPDVLARMHAGTKPQVMGVLLILAGGSIRLTGWSATWMLLLVAAFQLITAPVNAHMVSRIAYRRRHVRRDILFVDELADAPRGAELRAGQRGVSGDHPADAPPGYRTEPEVVEDGGAGDAGAVGDGTTDDETPDDGSDGVGTGGGRTGGDGTGGDRTGEGGASDAGTAGERVADQPAERPRG